MKLLIAAGLREILRGETALSASGFPTISEASFQRFLQEIPHLFRDGAEVLDFLAFERLAVEQATGESAATRDSVLRAIQVLETVIRTANITSPTDLWLLRQIFSTYQEMRLLPWMKSRSTFLLSDLQSHFQLDAIQLRFDLDLLTSRGYLQRDDHGVYSCSNLPQAQDIFSSITVLPRDFMDNWVENLEKIFRRQGSETLHRRTEDFFRLDAKPVARTSWVATLAELEYGYRLIPLVLALRRAFGNAGLQLGQCISEQGVSFPDALGDFLIQGGLLMKGGEISPLGERVFSRAPGPFGIIHAYADYLRHHQALLLGNRKNVWVARGENVAASRDANSRTFAQINDSLDRFCQRHGFHYRVFIEHAVGYGEATRQRLARAGEKNIQYFGADLEDAAIARALEAQARGELPRNMKFIHRADIGDPGYLIRAIESQGFPTIGAVMVVGNGFHEIRNQTNEKMIAVFRAYCQAGILLIFTEESALTNDDLLATAWNTYHAGFRYTHAISGQELRPAYDDDAAAGGPALYSWSKCVRLAGYQLLKEFSTHTRTIYPHPRANGRNPAISVTYFCVPAPVVE